MKRSSDGVDVFINCGCSLLLVIFNLWIGGWSVNYLLAFFLDKTIPTLGAMLIGLFTAQLSVPVAIVIALLRYFGAL